MLSIAKLQNLKAIHNELYFLISSTFVVINRKTTKFESNSQRAFNSPFNVSSCYQSQNYKIWKQFTTSLENEAKLRSCYQSQNYKIWKQFTTYSHRSILRMLLLSIAKLQNLKAIHNSQILLIDGYVVVINRKTTKFESNSQRLQGEESQTASCYQSQNYKIWKQFTTPPRWGIANSQLLSIAKLQNLKAIHNFSIAYKYPRSVVINHKTTKFESNSQLLGTLVV